MKLPNKNHSDNWFYKTKDEGWTVISDINKMPKGTIGFVYLIHFDDGTKYIGKKNIYITKTLKQPKSGVRPNTIKVIMRNTGKGFRQAYNIIQEESNWKEYKGSVVECKDKTPTDKIILHFCFTSYDLTYWEAYYQFRERVLFDNEFLNDNILGKFYRNKLTCGGKENEIFN